MKVETLRAVAHPWLCDVNNHLNTRYYQGFFDDAAMHLYAHCGFVSKGPGFENVGVADVKCTMEYIKEVRPGALVIVQSGFVKLGGKSMITAHQMVEPGSDDVVAACETTTVFFDLEQRRSRSIPDFVRTAAEAYMLGDGLA